MKTFLFLTDFSANATYAAEYGHHLASKMGANIVLCNALNVLDQLPQEEFVAWQMEGEDISLDLSNTELIDLKRHLEYSHASGFNPKIQRINYSGSVEDVIQNTIEKYKIDMIVMGTHESGSLRNILLSNHNQMMIKETTVPLLLVPPSAPKTNIKRIAFATDLKYVDVDLEYIFSLVKLAKLVDADILITHIGGDLQLSPLADQQKERLLTRISNEADYPHVYYKFLNNGSVKDGLESLCDSEQISILAVVPRKRNFIESLISPSLTQKIVKHLSVPLLVFPPR